MRTITLPELRVRYEAYREACILLKANYTTVPERRAAIYVRDEFERDVRDGILDDLFQESENW
jgi:hypothetical protein